jgi:hypothetical protein
MLLRFSSFHVNSFNITESFFPFLTLCLQLHIFRNSMVLDTVSKWWVRPKCSTYRIKWRSLDAHGLKSLLRSSEIIPLGVWMFVHVLLHYSLKVEAISGTELKFWEEPERQNETLLSLYEVLLSYKMIKGVRILFSKCIINVFVPILLAEERTILDLWNTWIAGWNLYRINVNMLLTVRRKCFMKTNSELATCTKSVLWKLLMQ